ncbi:hypothetical protein NDNC_0130 [Candidatus Nasuia deltocephalinicola]|uniref:50S ribosomal protein L13 n=1 Tax=Candidatus Nasuia deltocephalincola TaxID=1160784 RepID=A0A974WN03_9PROT|nr:hypothetical protein CU086_00495 [Candidatus Nasuia deltocephalinicola]WKD87090.1 uL13 family ribosomal protein [Candidatus Nasuia deltocephalinicola]BEH03847.1 hypothetical protein NDNC_0130 [Candidatus Nasuia deltocephalinicola]
MNWYLINLKNKNIGELSKFILKIFKMDKNIKIIIINENLIKREFKNHKKKYYYIHTKYIGNYKKKFLKTCKNKEIIKNSILKMIKNNIFKKNIKKNIKFLKKANLLFNLKNKILYF